MSAPVFLAEAGSLDACPPGSAYLLDGDEGRHAGVVQRRGVGERLDVVDGRGGRLRCVVEGVERAEVVLRVLERLAEPRPEPAVVLVQALAKGDRDELAIEAATEVGVDAVVPWQAERSVVVWRGDRAARSRARWVATVRAAAKQSRRSWLPHVEQPVDLRGLAARVAGVVGGGGAALVLHEEAELDLHRLPLPTAGSRVEILLIVGPEGGISDRELAALTEAGAVAARLGPHVLRTSTAGPVALGVLAALTGRWGHPPRVS